MKIPKEVLTLHLYIYEEVIAALQWAIITHNHTEAVFWGLELYDSGLMDDVFEALIATWAQHMGFGKNCLAALYNMIQLKECEDLDRDMWIYSLYIWSNIRNMDTTAFQLLVRGSTIPETWNIQFAHKTEYMNLESALTDCLLRGKLTEAWLIGRAIPSDRQWSLLESLCQKKDRAEAFSAIKSLEMSDSIKRSVCFVLTTISDSTMSQSFTVPNMSELPEEISNSIDLWDSEESMRKRRTFKVRPEALIDCSRVTLPTDESNLLDIQLDLEANLMASPCWQVILEDYMDQDNEGQWKSDIYREMFYGTYFPSSTDDIPDEWSLKDKGQSHGRGFGKTVNVAVRQYINNILRNKRCLGVYSPIQNVNDYMSQIISLDWDSVYSDIHSGCKRHLESKLPLKPVQIVFKLEP